MVQQELIEKHLELVKKIAAKIMCQLNISRQMEEMIAYGNEGLVKAARDFDPRYGLSFPAYATRRIKGAIYDGLRTMGWIPRNVYKDIQTAEATLAYLTAEEVRDRPAHHRPDASANTSKLDAMKQTICNLAVICLVADTAAEERKYWKKHLFTQGEENQSEAALIEREQATRLRRAIELLAPRERQLIQAFYFKDEPLADVSLKLGVSRSYAHKLHNRAINRLRKILNITSSTISREKLLQTGNPDNGAESSLIQPMRTKPAHDSRINPTIKRLSRLLQTQQTSLRLKGMLMAALLLWCVLMAKQHAHHAHRRLNKWARDTLHKLGEILELAVTRLNQSIASSCPAYPSPSPVALFLLTITVCTALAATGCTSQLTQDLSTTEAEQIVELLSGAGINARLEPTQKQPYPNGYGTGIKNKSERSGRDSRSTRARVVVPSSQTALARTIIDGSGLPKRHPPGLTETLPSGGLIPDRAAEQARLLRGLSGEIERVFLAIDGIVDARVLLSTHTITPRPRLHGLYPTPPRQPQGENISSTPTLWPGSPTSESGQSASVVLICQADGVINQPREKPSTLQTSTCPISEQQATHIVAGAIAEANPDQIRVVMLPYRRRQTTMANPPAASSAATAAPTTGTNPETDVTHQGSAHKAESSHLSMTAITVCSAAASLFLAIAVLLSALRKLRRERQSGSTPSTN